MRRVRAISGGLLLLAGLIVTPAAVAPLTEQKLDYRGDHRVGLLRSFFAKAECPAMHYVEVFLEAADRYALDWRLLPSLSYVESTGGKSAKGNNLFGWGTAQFTTPTAGIHAVGYRLANSSLYKDKDLDGVLSTYNRNADYPHRVKAVMRRISPE